jgi:deoxycytidine triphosphate deaminase
MTILASAAIFTAICDGAIVCDPAPRHIQGAHIDVTLGAFSWLWTPLRGATCVPLHDADPDDWFVRNDAERGLITLPPYGFILAHTMEAIGTAPGSGLIPMLHTRSTLARWGLSVCTANAGMGDQGWVGPWTLEIVNPHSETKLLPVGARVGAIVFHRTEGIGVDYLPGTRYNKVRAEWKPEDMLPRKGNW